MGKSKKKQSSPGELLVCSSPKAVKRFEIDERFEAGMQLKGSEVKSLRAKRADLEGSYASIDGGELWLHKMHIAPYEQAGPFGHEPKASRKLLVHRGQLERLRGKLAQRGYTLVPIRVYFRGGWAKVELGLGKGKKVVDRRDDIEKKRQVREAREAAQRGRDG